MSEKVEKIMKRIHLFFSNCDVYDEAAGQIIVPKKPMLNLLNDLNIAINEVMEEHEATLTSREREIKKHNKKAESILDDANEVAEDIYAASMIYTDRMLIELKDVIEHAGRELKKEYDFLAGQLASQVDMVTTNQDDLRRTLEYTKHSSKYTDIIKKYNDKEAKRKQEELNKKEKEEALEKEKLLAKEAEAEEKDDKSEVNLFDDDVTDEEDAEAVKSKEVKKIASVVDSSALSAEEEESVKKVSYEVRVNPSYFANSEFSSESLDAEYEQWMNADEEVAASDEEGGKNNSKKTFVKKKKKR